MGFIRRFYSLSCIIFYKTMDRLTNSLFLIRTIHVQINILSVIVFPFRMSFSSRTHKTCSLKCCEMLFFYSGAAIIAGMNLTWLSRFKKNQSFCSRVFMRFFDVWRIYYVFMTYLWGFLRFFCVFNRSLSYRVNISNTSYKLRVLSYTYFI